MRHVIRIVQNSLITDLSVEEGGGGSGPSPHDLYDAALGACTALTVLWYAKRKSIPVAGIEVSVERDASQERAGIYRLSAELTLTGDLNATHREELFRVAQRCPVQLAAADDVNLLTALGGEQVNRVRGQQPAVPLRSGVRGVGAPFNSQIARRLIRVKGDRLEDLIAELDRLIDFLQIDLFNRLERALLVFSREIHRYPHRFLASASAP